MSKQAIYVCDVRGCDETARVPLRSQTAPAGWLEMHASMQTGKMGVQQILVHCPAHAAELLERIGGWERRV